jgi:hypothetical protein
MKKIIFILLVVFGLYNYQVTKKNGQQRLFDTAETNAEITNNSAPETSTGNSQFKCDGRTHCSNMTSCAEATYFLQNCPNTEMDGDNDGIPREKQWCS